MPAALLLLVLRRRQADTTTAATATLPTTTTTTPAMGSTAQALRSSHERDWRREWEVCHRLLLGWAEGEVVLVLGEGVGVGMSAAMRSSASVGTVTSITRLVRLRH